MFRSKSRRAINIIRKDGAGGMANIMLRSIDNAFFPSKVHHKPISIQVEVTTKCNLKCKMCEHTYWKENGGDMDFNSFKRIIDQLPYLQTVNLTGIGEPLLNKDFFDIIEYAKRKGIYVWFNDNMTLLDPKKAEKLISLKVDAIAISLDGATKKTYENIREGANFEKVMGNIKALIDAKKRLKRDIPRLFFVSIIMKENLEELPMIVELAGSLGIKSILFVGILTFEDNINRSIEDVQKNQLERVFTKTEKRAGELGVDIALPSLTPRGIKKCRYPWMTPYITYDGNVIPCCFLTQRNNRELLRKNILGNVFKEDFDDIWNNKKYQKFRTRLLSKNPPSACKGCNLVRGIY